MERTRMSYQDLGKCFHLGSIDPVWVVKDVLQTAAVCNMVGTEDYAILPQELVIPLIEEYQEYWRNVYSC